MQEDELRAIDEEYAKLVETGKKLSSCKAVLAKEIKTKSIPEYIRTENENLIISDDKTEEHSLIQAHDNIENNKKVIVHCTNFFPKNNTILSNYDGGKITGAQVKYRGVCKNVPALDHRHEVHCTINNRVESTGDGAGNWDAPSYIIIDRYTNIKMRWNLLIHLMHGRKEQA